MPCPGYTAVCIS
uniref:Uncharacterized protein n=1 Tax=Arundo donax TaxID=35708 RepID=A0A0A9ENV7_ARUDO